MRCLWFTLPVIALVSLAAPPAGAQFLPHVRHIMPHVTHQAPIPDQPEPGTLTAAQQLAIAPVKWPAVWPAPKLAPGTIPIVPPRPDWMPQAGEYWGPFTDDDGGWGFLVGPKPPAPLPTFLPFPATLVPRARTAPSPPPAAPPPPSLPVAGPVSPDGRMVVTYPDGNKVTWQFPMLDYSSRFNGIGPGGAIQLTDLSGRPGRFKLAPNARVTLNGQPAPLNRLPIGARAAARALRLAPTTLTALDVTK